MRRFPVPFDLLEFEDKIFGGYLSIRQAIWILSPIVIGFFIFMDASSYMKHSQILWGSILLRLLLLLVAEIIGVIMSFGRKKNMAIDKYLLKSFRYHYSKNTIKHYE
jgi:hypothetical protein